ncbi:MULTISPECIES: flagellar hook-length control protein FliK [Bradyrhizobium]|uniref:flagellar hook-length control protein FliK n=1 Tax=Bradyrhizobium TaxID=374 RepID=UPI00048570A9|nr:MULTISPECIES: flagellar hook-length control protein FliK [Bradyrhizobium]QOG19716.1 flagellar hook-length control protein FliK [Bradyrhizobium sp. SEMIA]UFW50962.1 flagellar hook-length control protein FliK [Bradyrhizobium arachidis]
MVGRTSDVAASVQVPSAQQKPAKSQGSRDTSDSFGSLVDSNTQAISNNAGTQDTAPRRSDSATSSSSASDRSTRDTSSSDSSSQSKASDDTEPSTSASSDTTTDSAKAADKAGKAKDKSETSDAKPADKSDQTKADKNDTTDGLAAAVDATATAQTGATQAAVPDPNAIPVAAPVVPVDPNATANQASDAASPLTIAAAGLAASASTAAQIAGNKTDTATAGDKSAKTAGAKVAADTSATLGDTATTDGTATDAKTSGGLIAVADLGTPKTSFKAAATAQGQTDVSNIGQDAGKANATTQGPAATTANAAHAQGIKPQADSGTVDAKADAKAGVADATPATTTHHASAQAAVPTTDTSAQAASAIQAPVTNTTSAATASTATLTATAATNTAVPLNAVPIEIAAAARAGKTRFDISLDPVELGRIDVRINVDRNGQVTSHLTVEKPETLAMLKQDAPQLQRALDDAGFKTGSNGLSFSLRDQNSSGQQSGQNNDNGGNARRLIISEDESVTAAPVGRGYGRMLGSSSGVDIRV